MSKSIGFFVALSLMALAIGQPASCGLSEMFEGLQAKHIRNVYEEINEYMNEHADIANREDLIEKARDMLNEPKKSKDVKEILKKLVHLGDEQCDLETTETLKQTLQRLRSYGSGESFDRVANINRIVWYFLPKHTRNCQQFYSSQLNEKLSSIEANTLTTVLNFTKGAIEGHPFRFPDFTTFGRSISWDPKMMLNNKDIESRFVRLPKSGVFTIISMYPQLDQHFYFDALDFLSQADENHKFVVKDGSQAPNKLEIQKLFERYLYNPCNAFVQELETNGFSDNLKFFVTEANPVAWSDMPDLALAQASFNICKRLVNDKQAVDSIVNCINK